MDWQQLLSEKRKAQPVRRSDKVRDFRSEFEKDYHRIIGSASFRRLQDKTQVFPLDKSDFIRTRLTHSLEVSSFARALGEIISTSILERGQDKTFSLKTKEDICEILQCAGLIHDIGNPPFGHFGEESIREWFVHNLPELTYHGQKVTDMLDDQQINDLLHFEGNAQGLRLVSKLHFQSNENGLDLTFGLLSAVMKYPTSSVEIEADGNCIQRKKLGYFKAEEGLVKEVIKETGTCIIADHDTCNKGNGPAACRNPLAFILEAADDIAYATADIEDAYKKGFISYHTLVHELSLRDVPIRYIAKMEDIYKKALEDKAHNPEEYAIMNGLVHFQGVLLNSASEGFMSHYSAIMTGEYGFDLFAGTPAESLLKALKNIAYDYAFTTDSIFRTEIAANTILTYLMDHLALAALSYDEDKAPGLMDEKFLSLISENYKDTYHRCAKGTSENDKLYYKLLLLTDSVSGMTVSYARDLYRDLVVM
ncbi:MAG: deoxyguanosinetriphosphate triphosphohydrolase [Lachnospiraceae bacterium]|nr:deoxyguanosinetriphosphate triphosphohydrolase [Candidatus Equihabitans merdae]